MNNRRTIGITFSILGLLLTCCLCPAFLDASLKLSGIRTGLYGQAFGDLTTATNVLAGQLLCATALAFIALLVGIIVLLQAGNKTSQ